MSSMRYFVYEDKHDVYETFLEAETPQEAIEIGEKMWDHLGKIDQKNCIAFSVCAIDDEWVDEYDCMSPDCPGWDVLKRFK